MSRPMPRRLTAGLLALVIAPAALTGCGRTIEGTAMKAGTGVARGDNSADKYPNLLKECDVLTADVLAYKQRETEARLAVLDELAAEGQKLKVGY